MKSYEMVEMLSSRANVSLEQAKEALERSNWDILDAAIYIERQRSAPQGPPPGSAFFSGAQTPPPPGGFATQGFGRKKPFDPRTDFNKPHGGFAPPPYVGQQPHTPPYKDFPRKPPMPPYPFGSQPQQPPVPPYKDFPQRPPVPPYTGSDSLDALGRSVGGFINGLGDLIEKLVNALFKTKFMAVRNGATVFSMPLLVFIILAIPFLWFLIPALVLGLAFNCRYTVGDEVPFIPNCNPQYGQYQGYAQPQPQAQLQAQPQEKKPHVSLDKKDTDQPENTADTIDTIDTTEENKNDDNNKDSEGEKE